MTIETYKESSHQTHSDYHHISDYAIIGDSHTAALIATDASIDWLCMPYFDSPAIFARLIGNDKGGYLAIEDPVSNKVPIALDQHYLPNTAILQTTLAIDGNTLVITDFFTMSANEHHFQNHTPHLVRQITALAGPVCFAIVLKTSPDFARATPHMTINHEGVVVTQNSERGGGVLVMSYTNGAECSGSLENNFIGPFRDIRTLQEGETLTLVISWADNPFLGSHIRRQNTRSWDRDFSETLQYWQQWTETLSHTGMYCEQIMRSAISLKLLTFSPTGAIVAAPTTSLPESIGGNRNWDYRYTWIRDASLTASTLAMLGKHHEAIAFIHWVEHRERRSDRELRIMYSIWGNRNLTELEVAPLAGYENSPPVRIGNAASDQQQLDIYGEWLDCIAQEYLRDDATSPDHWLWSLIDASVTFVCDHWMEPDAGIWEVRSARQNFTYSKIMCWVAIDRGIKLAYHFSWRVDIDRWERVRTLIYADILHRGIHPETQIFKISYESHGLDAATLIAPIVGFLPPDHPAIVATVNAIMQELTDENGFVYRYRDFDDGVNGKEGTFIMCSFWLVENLAMQGRIEEATTLFHKLLAHTSPTGLLSEMLDTETGELLGNYPQAFSHLGLIRSALALAHFSN